MEKEKALFLKAYANVPEPLKNDIIVLIDGQPYSWNTAFFEIKKGTGLGGEILKSLKRLGILE